MCAADRGASIAIRSQGVSITYAELSERQDRAAAALRDRGVAAGDRVAIALRDSPELIAAFLGAAKLGAIPVPLSTLASREARELMVRDSGARLVVAEDDAGWLASGGTGVTAAPTDGNDMCFWQYSSGTTGEPKAVIHLHRGAVAPALGHGRHVVGLEPADRVLSTAKLFFSYGLQSSMIIPLATGASVVLDPERFAAGRVWALIARERPTVLYAVPSAYAALLAEAESGTHAEVGSLRCCVSAGETLPAPIADRWRDRFGLSILDGMGSTEIGYIAISNTADNVTPGSSGRPVPGYDARVVAEDGDDVADGEAGTLWVRGPSTARGYHARPERTAAVFRDGWVVTGDRYRVQDGRYTHLGRDDDMLRVGAQWVSPLEVEAVIGGHPAVVECAVVGRAAADGLTRACAYVVASGGSKALSAELMAYCAERLPRHKCPRWIEIVPELPKTATGKIQRHRLREGAAG